MAEIKVEKKKPIWPWIILVLVILALLYFFVFANDDDSNMDNNENTEQVQEQDTAWGTENDTTNWDTAGDTLSASGQGVEGFLSYVSDDSRMGIDHEYTNNALIRLVNAVEAKANEVDYNIDNEIQPIREEANKIQQDPTATTHANTIKDAGTKIADVLQNIQEEEYPNLSGDVEEVKTAANNIDTSTQTLEQREQVKKFFDEAADVLRKMS